MCTLSILYIRGVSEKCARISEIYNTNNVFKTKYTLGFFFSFLRKMEPNKDKLDRSQCAYKIPCDCGREYIGKNGIPLGVRMWEHKYNLR